MDHMQFMNKALELARQALEAGEFPVGCVLVHDGRVIAQGARVGVAAGGTGELEHAEMVAMARFENMENAPPPSEVTIYCTMEPCLMCFGALMIHGITKIVYAYEDAMGGATALDRSTLPPLYRDAKVEITPHVGRSQSLALFKAFFSRPDNHYWKDSLLAKYTLEQEAE
ncbi:nucleoside deaminase [Desulfatibacillum aliphaticivorans]|uniref:nucleoside deaminase n=1 Tax=Desulfatibacillum aliphaticivorans TaxID=218208 RepID=UPI0004845C93|nr:nucleoside deaminase [Desulfatibacillum aliphaticivorans]